MLDRRQLLSAGASAAALAIAPAAAPAKVRKGPAGTAFYTVCDQKGPTTVRRYWPF